MQSNITQFANPDAIAEQAMQYFSDGYNCAQSVLLAFAPALKLDEALALKLAAPFGGGMGRLREVCGAVSGAFMAAGLIYGYTDADDLVGKKACYQVVQDLAAAFAKQNGSIICHELRGLPQMPQDLPPVERYLNPETPEADLRTPQYYTSRPCKQLVGDAARILAAYISQHPPAL